jgi:hypothetical protein
MAPLRRIQAMPRPLRVVVLTGVGSVLALACLFCCMVAGELYLPHP